MGSIPPPTSSRRRYREFLNLYRNDPLGETGRGWPWDRFRSLTIRLPTARTSSRDSTFQGYLRLIRPYWLPLLLVLCLAIAIESLKMTAPLLLRFLMDRVLLDSASSSSARLRWLNVIGVLFVAIVVFEQLITVLKEDRQRLVDVRLKVSLRRTLMERLLALPLSKLSELKTGGILSRLTGDVDLASGILQKAVIIPASSMVRLAIAAAILLNLNWQLALSILGALPGLVFVSFAMSWRVRPIYLSIRNDAADIDARTAEAFAGIRVVRAFRRTALETVEYVRGQHTMLRKEMYASRLELFLWMAWGLLLGGVNVVIIWYGGFLHLQGRATVGDIMAFQWYALFLLNPVLNVVQSFSQLQRSQAATDRVLQLLSMEPDKPDRPGSMDAPNVVHDICFDSVGFHYSADRPLISNLSVRVPGGSLVALVGKSGAGKTTITDLVARFHDPTQGRITLNGQDIRDFRLGSYRSLFAIVQQHTFLFDGSVRENIAYGRPHASDLEIEHAARQANAHNFIETLPDRYDTRIGERGVKLSGGQQQRLAIARAFLKSAAILIMDEATSNLDTESEQLVHESMTQLMASRTTFVIAHRLSTIQRSDLILVIDKGSIVEQGKHEELMRNGRGYRDMVLRQMMNSCGAGIALKG